MIIGIIASSPVIAGGGPPSGLPTVIGEAFGGGWYIGDITVASGGADDGTYAVIAGGSESQAPTTLAWETPLSGNSLVGSMTNGLANTLAMQAADPVTHHAAMYCINYRGGGYDDWYLAARDELNLAWLNRGQLAMLAMDSQYYFCSTQFSTNNAWRQTFANGYQGSDLKSASYRVRPFRRLLRTP